MYERVIRESMRVEDLRTYLHGPTLRRGVVPALAATQGPGDVGVPLPGPDRRSLSYGPVSPATRASRIGSCGSVWLLGPSFARLAITDPAAGNTSTVELGVDWRAYPPVQLAIGPVLHPADAVANELCALFGRAEVRDYVDVYGVLEDGRYAGTKCCAWRPTATLGSTRTSSPTSSARSVDFRIQPSSRTSSARRDRRPMHPPADLGRRDRSQRFLIHSTKCRFSCRNRSACRRRPLARPRWRSPCGAEGRQRRRRRRSSIPSPWRTCRGDADMGVQRVHRLTHPLHLPPHVSRSGCRPAALRGCQRIAGNC